LTQFRELRQFWLCTCQSYDCPKSKIYVEPDEIHYFQASADEALGFLCAVLDKDLRVSAHGEQRLTIFG